MNSLTHDADLAQEASQWSDGTLTPEGWQDAPEAVPRTGESVILGIQLSNKLFEIIQEFAKRNGVNHQVLINRWLIDRVKVEKSKT